MDEKSRLFLVTIAHTLAVTILWMLVNMTLGIYKGYAFPDNGFGWKNVLFYVFFLGSGIFIAIHLFKKWHKIYKSNY